MVSFSELVATYVWPVTIVSAIASTSIFAMIVILRVFTDKRKNKKALRQKEIIKYISVHLVSPLKNPRGVLIKKERDMELLAEVASSMLRNLKGDSYQALKNMLKEIGLVEWLSKNLHGNNIKRKIAAIRLSSYWSDDALIAHVIALLGHKEPLVQQAAIIALAETKNTALFPMILSEVKRHETFSYLVLCDIFQQFGSEINDQLTLAALSEHSPTRVKMAALMALDKAGDLVAIKAVALPLCEHKDAVMRAQAYKALANNNIYIPEPLLKQGAEDEHWEVRKNVAECLAAHKPLPVNIVQQLLNDVKWLVGFQSAKMLYLSGEIGKQLLQKIATKDNIMGKRARMILMEMDTFDGVA